jgi:hypothetical protein
MGENRENEALGKIVIVLILIAVAIIAAVYYATHREITDPQVLIAKTIAASEDVKSYQFAFSTNISIPEGDIEMMSSAGYVDYQNKEIRTTVRVMNRSLEMIVINDTAYVRESYGSWQKPELDEYYIWKSYDELEQQNSILRNATNVTMHKDDEGWVLNVIPEREEVIAQMKRDGIVLGGGEELKNFTITYWIEKGSYYITRIENNIELTMNIYGLLTPVKLKYCINLSDYNKKMEIDAPII